MGAAENTRNRTADYFPDADWQRKTPARSRHRRPPPAGRDRPRDRGRSEEPARSRAQSLPEFRPRAVRRRDRADQGPRRRRPASSSTKAPSSRNGASRQRVDMTHSITKSMLSCGRGARVRPRPDPEHRRHRARIRRADPALQPRARRQQVGPDGALRSPLPLRYAAQPHDHVEPHAAPGERLGRHAVGQTRLG